MLRLLLSLSVSCLAMQVHADPKPIHPSGNGPAPETTLSEDPAQDSYLIHGAFDTQAQPEGVWLVLSDYQGLVGKLSGLKSSRILERKGNAVLLEQEMEGHFLVFSKTLALRLQLREQAPRRIEFALAGKGPFRIYRGAWAINPTRSGCQVDYTLRISRGDLAPHFIERRLFRENAENLLNEIGQEIDRGTGISKTLTKF